MIKAVQVKYIPWSIARLKGLWPDDVGDAESGRDECTSCYLRNKFVLAAAARLM